MNPMHSRLALACIVASTLVPGARTFAQGPPQAPPQAPPQMPSGPIEVNGIAAKVNAHVITKNQVTFLLAPLFAQLSAQFPRRGPQFEAKFRESKANVIQELVDRQIILDHFKELGGSIKPFLIEEEIKRQMRELYNGDETKFREELRRSRLTMEGYRDMTREKMIVQAMRAQMFADAPPPLPNEIQKEYNEIKPNLRDVTKDVISFQKIFIPSIEQGNPGVTPDSQLALAEDLAKQISEGKDFTELAKANSKDAYAEAGGIQNNVPRTDLSPEFASIIFETPEGKVVGPLMDRSGFTIVKPIKIVFGPSPALGDPQVRKMVEERVTKKKTSAQYEDWIKKQRKKAMIKINE